MNTEKSNEYLLLFRGRAWYNQLSPEELQTAMTRFKSWFEQLNAQGRVRAAQPLAREGNLVSGRQRRVVADGPFPESKEAIGGYFLVTADGLEEATELAKGCPGLDHGMEVEVRPIAAECPMVECARRQMPEDQTVRAAA